MRKWRVRGIPYSSQGIWLPLCQSPCPPRSIRVNVRDTPSLNPRSSFEISFVYVKSHYVRKLQKSRAQAHP